MMDDFIRKYEEDGKIFVHRPRLGDIEVVRWSNFHWAEQDIEDAKAVIQLWPGAYFVSRGTNSVELWGEDTDNPENNELGAVLSLLPFDTFPTLERGWIVRLKDIVLSDRKS